MERWLCGCSVGLEFGYGLIGWAVGVVSIVKQLELSDNSGPLLLTFMQIKEVTRRVSIR